MNQPDPTVERLQARIAELEAEVADHGDERATVAAETAAARAPSSAGRRTRSVFSAILIVLALVLAPLAVVAGTVKPLLADTDAFVAAYAPLAQDPRVQATVSGASINAINEAIDLETLAADVFDGIATLDLPPRAAAALELLEGPAVAGAQSLIERSVTELVASPQFANVWRQMLVVAHTQVLATMNASPDAALSINDVGLTLNLKPLVAEVRERLVANGIGLAANIPDIDRTIQLVESDALVTARIGYLVAVAVGTWLPLVTLVILGLGIAIAVNHRAALLRGAIALGIVMLALWAALTIGRDAAAVFVTAPAVAPGTVEVLYDATLENTVRASIAVAFVGFAAAFAAWFSGGGTVATRLRAFATSGARGIRAAGAKHGITTGRVGRFLDRFHWVAVAVVVLIAVLVIVFTKPITVGLVIWTLVLSLVAVFVLEVLRLPEAEAEAAKARAAAATPDGSPEASTVIPADEAAGPRASGAQTPANTITGGSGRFR